jgi:methionyl-tRNA formyltransferase
MRFAVLGRTEMLFNAIEKVEAQGHTLALVGSAEHSPESVVSSDTFRDLAKARNVPFFHAVRLGANEAAAIRDARVDFIISMNWPTLINTEVVEAGKGRVINAHGSLLPLLRGNACPNWAILLGHKQTGFSLHHVEAAGFDIGDIVLQRSFPLNDDVYIGDVYDWLRTEIPLGFAEAARLLFSPGFKPQVQKHALATRAYSRRREDAQIDWNKSALDVHRLIRASSRPFPGAFTRHEGRQDIVIWRAEQVALDMESYAIPGQVMWFENGQPVIACGDGAIRITEFSTGDGAPLPRSIRARMFM